MENITKAIGNVTEALKTQPLILAVLVMNVVFLFFLYWILHEVAAVRATERTTLKQAIDQNYNVLVELQRTCVRFEPPPERRQ